MDLDEIKRLNLIVDALVSATLELKSEVDKQKVINRNLDRRIKVFETKFRKLK